MVVICSTTTIFRAAFLLVVALEKRTVCSFAFVHPLRAVSTKKASRWLAGNDLRQSVTRQTISAWNAAGGRGNWDQEIEENSRRRAVQKGSTGVGETAAGAILGGLLLGPFGALFGASVGSNIGAKNAMDRARQEEMERLGITPDMLNMANEIGVALERSMEGVKATQDSLETQQRFAKSLDRDSKALYDRAMQAMTQSDDEAAARRYLMEKQQITEKLKTVLKQCAEEKQRLEQMEQNVRVLEQRAYEVDALLRRTVGAKKVQEANADVLDFSLSSSDPLLDKFRDAGIDY